LNTALEARFLATASATLEVPAMLTGAYDEVLVFNLWKFILAAGS